MANNNSALNADLSVLDRFRFIGSVEDDTQPEPQEKDLSGQLQTLLANVSVFYHATHEYHWNVTGNDFYQYHKFFDEIVSDVYESIDPIAENIRKLGKQPVYNMHDLVDHATIKPTTVDSTESISYAKELSKLNSSLIEFIKATFDMANKDNEQGIANFLAERIDQHQKWQWFLDSSIGK